MCTAECTVVKLAINLEMTKQRQNFLLDSAWLSVQDCFFKSWHPLMPALHWVTTWLRINLFSLYVPVLVKENLSDKVYSYPGDFVSKVKQINSQSDLIWMRSFAGPCYLTIKSSVCIILIWDSCIFNLYNLRQTGSNYMRREPQQYALHFNE